jgi:hypothetical protein
MRDMRAEEEVLEEGVLEEGVLEEEVLEEGALEEALEGMVLLPSPSPRRKRNDFLFSAVGV